MSTQKKTQREGEGENWSPIQVQAPGAVTCLLLACFLPAGLPACLFASPPPSSLHPWSELDFWGGGWKPKGPTTVETMTDMEERKKEKKEMTRRERQFRQLILAFSQTDQGDEHRESVCVCVSE